MRHLAVIAFVALGTYLVAKTQTGDTAKELIAAERRFSDALLQADWKKVEQIEAEDLVFTNADGSVTHRSDDVGGIKSGDTKFESIEMANIKVQDLGDVAVVTGGLVEKGRYKGTDVSGMYRFTDVWAKRNGTWQLLAGQETRYPSAASTSSSLSSENAAAVEEDLFQLERTWAKAEEKYDPKVLDEILAKDFVSMNGAGEVKNKAQEIASDAEPMPGDDELVDDMSVHIYGDSAVVVGRFTWTDRTSGSVKLQGRFVDTVVLRSGQWKVVANSYVHTDAGNLVPKHLVGR